MALIYQGNGNLVPGIHLMTWTDFIKEFGHNSHRVSLIKGVELAISDLKSCGCKTIYVDGSFTTKKPLPNDYDACYNTHGMDFPKLFANFPEFFDSSPGRKQMKAKYQGELFPMTAPASSSMIFIDFFQHDRDGYPKGIVQLNI
jgi:hypothetical protein